MDWTIFFNFFITLGIILGLLTAIILAFSSIFWINWRFYTSDDVKNCSYLGEWIGDNFKKIDRKSLLWKIFCQPLPWYTVVLSIISMLISIALLFSVTEENGRALANISKGIATWLILVLFGLMMGHPNRAGGGGC